MKMNWLGLGLHFVLELLAMAALVAWGFRTGQGIWQKILLGVILPLAAAALWGIFRFPNDPTPALVAIPGPLRLLLELVILGGAALALAAAGWKNQGILFAAAIVIDYLLMLERIRRLLFDA